MRNLLATFTLIGLLMFSTGVWAQGSSLNDTSIGLTTPQAGKFTNLETDTLQTDTLEATTSIKLGTETITNFSGIDDDKVKVSSGDTPGFLDSKIVAGNGITVTPGTSDITISAPPVNVEDSADGVEVTFAREFEFDAGSGLAPALDLNGTALIIGATTPTITVGGQTRNVLATADIPNTTPALQQVIVDLPDSQLAGEHKLKLSNTQGFSEGFISLGKIETPVPGNDAFTTLLLHADDTGNGFVDSSASNNTIIANGDTTQSTAQIQFGDKSALFDGDGDYLSIASSNNWAFGTGDFTIDFWIYLNSALGADNFLSTFTNGLFAEPSFEVRLSLSGTQWNVREPGNVNHDGGAVVLGEWVHIAFSRESNTARLFENGIEVVTWTDTNNYPSNPLTIGARNLGTGSQFMDGFMDELRISKGIARYTANFIPPTGPFN
jgi:hypothetical protein